MPHTGVVLTFFALTGLNHKNGFKYQFVGMTGANLLALIAVIIAALLLSSIFGMVLLWICSSYKREQASELPCI